MKKSIVGRLNDANSIEELESILEADAIVDISYRGGGLGFHARDVARLAEVDSDFLPGKFGAFCNYLGGGLRGRIVGSDWDSEIEGKSRDILEALSKACVRAYETAEHEAGLLEDEDEDGETNWENIGTKKARAAGVISGY